MRYRGIPLALFCALLLTVTIIKSSSAGQPGGNAVVLPVSGPPLEPSGLTLYEDKLLCVSDNPDDNRLYELKPGTDTCGISVFLTFRQDDLLKLKKNFRLDLEGLTYMNGYFYTVDERDRYIYRISPFGRVWMVKHDVSSYNAHHNISWSDDDNAGFEGIAADPMRRLLFVANEREPALIYRLRVTPNELEAVVEDHLSLNELLGTVSADVSDLCWERESLYLIHRRANRVLKLDPYGRRITGSMDFGPAVASLYVSRKGHGFAEGLFLTKEKVYLLLDSNGRSLEGKSRGKSGALVVLERPAGF